MRRSTPVLVVTLVVGTAVGGGMVPVAEADHREEVTIEGTVLAPDGDPASDAVVLVGQDSTLTELSPDELRDVADGDPQDLTAVDVGTDGRFEATVPYAHAEAAVALSGTGVSDLRYLRHEDRSLDIQLYERRPQTVHAHLGAVGHDERRADLFVNLVNSGDTAIANLSVTVASLPEGWSVATVGTNGTYDPGTRTLTWSAVPPEGEVDTTVVLAVPDGTPPGEYRVALRAGSDTHRVDVGSETVEVLPEETPGPTTTPSPTAGTHTAGTTYSPGTTTPTTRTTRVAPTTTTATGPGPGVLGAVAAVTLLAVVLLRRR